MRAAARVGRFGLPFVLLLVLLGVTAAPGARQVEPHRSVGESVSAAPTVHEDPHDRPRLSVTAWFAPAAAPHEVWWALCSHGTQARPPSGRPPLGEVAGSGWVARVPTSRSSRGPPA